MALKVILWTSGIAAVRERSVWNRVRGAHGVHQIPFNGAVNKVEKQPRGSQSGAIRRERERERR